MGELLSRFHLSFWYRMHMAHAYLAYHRGDMVECAEHENEARRYEGDLQLLQLQRRLKCVQ